MSTLVSYRCGYCFELQQLQKKISKILHKYKRFFGKKGVKIFRKICVFVLNGNAMTGLLVIYVAIKHNNSIITYTFYLYHISDSFKIWYKNSSDTDVRRIKMYFLGYIFKSNIKKEVLLNQN